MILILTTICTLHKAPKVELYARWAKNVAKYELFFYPVPYKSIHIHLTFHILLSFNYKLQYFIGILGELPSTAVVQSCKLLLIIWLKKYRTKT